MSDLDADETVTRSELGRKLLAALRAVNDPHAIMESVADRATNGLRVELATRLDGVEKAAELWREDWTRVPTEVQKAVSSLSELLSTKIATIDARLTNEVALVNRHADIAVRTNADLIEEKIRALRETLRVIEEHISQNFRASELQVEKAFSAAKDLGTEREHANSAAIAKSEAGTTKQIDQLVIAQQTAVKNTDDKMASIETNFGDKHAGLEKRVAAIENRGAGHKEGTSDFMGTIGWIVGIIAAALAALQFILHSTPIASH